MTQEKMTIHKALSELKVIDKRIRELICMSTFVDMNKHSNTKIKGVSVDEYETSIRSSYDKITDLIKRRNAIKRAVVRSNAITTVKIADVEYTVAEAIEFKNHAIELDDYLKRTMKDQLNSIVSNLNRRNEAVADAAEQYISGMYSNKESAKVEDIEADRQKYIENNSYDMIDPIKVADKVQEMEDKIFAFLNDVDSVLSESNALTFIEIEY